MPSLFNRFSAIADDDVCPSLSSSDRKELCLSAGLWAYTAEAEQACLHCCPAQSMETDHWVCDHARFQLIQSWDVPFQKGHSVAECVGNCSEHPLLSGSNLLLEIADRIGESWADCGERNGWLSFEGGGGPSLEELAAAAFREERQKQAGIIAHQKQMADTAVARGDVEVMYNHTTGRPMPCRYYKFNGVIGAVDPGDADHPAGCAGHASGGPCSVHKITGIAQYFFHPTDPEWQFIADPSLPFTLPKRSLALPAPTADAVAPQAEVRSFAALGPSRPSSAGWNSRPSSAGSVATVPAARESCTNPICVAAKKNRNHSFADCGAEGGPKHSRHRARRN